jgi:hypothetical protein
MPCRWRGFAFGAAAAWAFSTGRTGRLAGLPALPRLADRRRARRDDRPGDRHRQRARPLPRRPVRPCGVRAPLLALASATGGLGAGAGRGRGPRRPVDPLRRRAGALSPANRGEAAEPAPPSRNPLLRLYETVAGSLDRAAAPFDSALAAASDPARVRDPLRQLGVAAAAADGPAQQQHARAADLARLPCRRPALVLVDRAGPADASSRRPECCGTGGWSGDWPARPERQSLGRVTPRWPIYLPARSA